MHDDTHWTGAARVPTRRGRSRVRQLIAGLAVGSSALLSVPLAASAAHAAPSPPAGVAAVSAAVARLSTTAIATPAHGGHAATHPRTDPSCTYNGQTDIVPNVTPGAPIAVSCTGWPASEQVVAAQFSPLLLANNDQNAIDPDVQIFSTDGAGNLNATFVVPNPFTAPDPAAVCPPTADQVAQGLLRCGIALADQPGNASIVALDYGAAPPPAPPAAVGLASTPDGGGYWIAWSNGNVTDHGDAGNYGNASGLPLTAPITHIVSTPDGRGYWLVAGDGGTFTYGDAGFFGSTGGLALNAPVVDMAPTPSGHGYWLAASDGGIFAFGDAPFQGSMGGTPLNKPVVGIAGHPNGGYWMVASDGGIFAFGGAPFYGSTGGMTLNRPVNGMAATPSGNGYWFVASDGGVFSFGDAVFHGSTGGMALAAPVVGMAADNATGGYWLLGADGGVFSFGAPFYGSH